MELRELVIIVLAALAGCAFIWYETGRDPLLLKAMAALIGLFTLGGAFAVLVS